MHLIYFYQRHNQDYFRKNVQKCSKLPHLENKNPGFVSSSRSGLIWAATHPSSKLCRNLFVGLFDTRITQKQPNEKRDTGGNITASEELNISFGALERTEPGKDAQKKYLNVDLKFF